MSSDLWKRFPTIPGFDCLKMKRDIQAKIREETKHMTQEQRLEYYRISARKLRRRGRTVPLAAEPSFVKEESVSYGARRLRKG